jgi:hypothetical protein
VLTRLLAVGGATKWAADKIGPAAWFILGGLVLGAGFSVARVAGVAIYGDEPDFG